MSSVAACPACAAAPLAEGIAARPDLQFSVPEVHCAACIGKIERGLANLSGVAEVRVNLSLKRLSVTGTAPVKAVEEALKDLGFEAYLLDPNALGRTRDEAGRSLLTRMAVAGFAMMNVMLLSVAVWSGATDATRDLFHLISAAIALPVVAYAAQPFFRSALRALRVGSLNMDVPISLAIILAAGMSLYETLNSGEHAYFDAALSLTFFLLIGRYMDHQTRSAAHSAAKELTALESHTAQRVEGRNVRTVPLTDVALEDVLQVPTGARVPVDGILLDQSAWMDRAFLTGESEAVEAAAGSLLQAGEINLAAPLRLRATAVGQETTLRRMAALVETAENGRNAYTALADRAAQVYAPAVHLLALAAFLGWVLWDGDMRHALNVAIAVLIITCPCALGLAVPAVSTAAISRLFSAGFLVKHATALERLAEIDHVIFDKTGTLTRPAIVTTEGLNARERSIALALAQASDHPLSRALAAALRHEEAAHLSDITEHPGQGVSGRTEGLEARLGRGAWLGADFDGLGLKIGASDALPLAAREQLRDDAVEVIAALPLPAEIVTGDSAGPAALVADRLGLPVTSGARPEAKLARLESLSGAGHRVLMVGDGLNDTAALARAHASLAPSSALEASRSAADIVSLKESLPDLPFVLRIARATRDLSRQNFRIATLYNLVAVPIALAGFATPLAAALAMSLSSITVLLNSQRMRSIR
ncbi:MAG: heavy metal translocating P-type ATPase [Sulfitobacter sp.]|nr:heavy metal translocating P-type ATPase [Sulfitobacter sp.]